MKYILILNIFLIGCVSNVIDNRSHLKNKGTCVRIISKGKEIIVPCD